MRVPVLPRHKQVPAWSPQEHPHNDQSNPEHQKTKRVNPYRRFSLMIGVITVSFGIHIQIRNQHQSNDDEDGSHHTGEPGVEINQYVLKPEEIPGRFGRIWGFSRIRRFFQRRINNDRPYCKSRNGENSAKKLQPDQIGPYMELFPTQPFYLFLWCRRHLSHIFLAP